MQYGFYFDQTRCIGCHACVVACKDWNDVKPGPVSLRKLHVSYDGEFPATKVYNTVYSCNHCADPKCVPACPLGAIQKEGQFGAVRIDREICQGKGKCIEECPYHAPQMADTGANSDLNYIQEPVKGANWIIDHPANKCDMCYSRITDGKKPACVMACPQRAIDWGPLSELQARPGVKDKVKFDFPDPAATKPSIVFKARE